MSFALRLYERFRVLIHEAAKFGVVGLAGFIVSLGGADVLHFDAGVGKYKAVVVATIVATVVTFLGNRYWAFRHRSGPGWAGKPSCSSCSTGSGCSSSWPASRSSQDGLNLQGKISYNVANLVGIGLGTLFRFWSYRKWVWRTQDPAAGVQAGRHRPVAPAPGFAEAGLPEAGFPEAGVAGAVAVGLDEEATLYGRGAEEYEHGAGNYGEAEELAAGVRRRARPVRRELRPPGRGLRPRRPRGWQRQPPGPPRRAELTSSPSPIVDAHGCPTTMAVRTLSRTTHGIPWPGTPEASVTHATAATPGLTRTPLDGGPGLACGPGVKRPRIPCERVPADPRQGFPACPRGAGPGWGDRAGRGVRCGDLWG